MFHPSATGMVGSLTPHRKGFLISLFVAGGGIGLAVGQKIYYYVYEANNENTLILFILPLAGIIAYFFLPSQAFTTQEKEDQSANQKNFSSIFQVFKKLKGLYFLMVLIL